MNMRYLAFLVIILIAGVALADTKLKKTQITKEVSLLLPRDFTPMPDDGIARKYPAANKPVAVYTSPNGQVDFSMTQKRSQFGAQDLHMLREIYKANLLERFTKVDFIRDEVTNINGRDYIVFEFVSVMADERKATNLAPVQKYSIMQYTIQGNQLMVFSMHLPFVMKNDWQDPAREIMGSIKIK
ncbi:hypothetical protein H9Q13_05340 [Pontibacter sp. JH31]|uniref:DUF1795 domain-containing protein n=2 Tax=Pontibacter aquaedesilientis TaxID=2766980 RepID=A0ABR7XE86_9BACT|nr:hypothetical protein [Pontibacter aquaedesilientis]